MSDSADQGEVFSDFSLKIFASEREVGFCFWFLGFFWVYFVSSDVDRKVP